MLQKKILNPNPGKINILVTGGAGLVGKELIKQLLSSGENITALSHRAAISLSHPNLNIVSGSILDISALEEIMEGITHVYHCAGMVSFEPKDKRSLLKINVEGTANIVNACISTGVKKIIHVSSVAALGRIREGATITEEMNWSEETSNSIYGKSKYFGELEVWRGMGEGLQAVIVNPTIILGGDNWETGSSAIFKKAYDEFKWYADGISGFVDVRDVVRAMILLMNSEINEKRFILNGENLSYKKIFSLIAQCFDKKPPYKKVTPLIANFIWRIEAIKGRLTGKEVLVTKETVETALAKVFFDNSKILEALPGFHFTPVENTIQFACSAMKEKYNL